MAAEHVQVPAHASDLATATVAHAPGVAPVSPLPALEQPRTPIDDDLIDLASGMAPGKALDLGCGEGQNSIWLAQRGWIVNAVDPSPAAIAAARELAAAGAVDTTARFEVADLADWRPTSRYDLVSCVLAIPARGRGRSRMLEMAAAAVAPGGTILLTELDISLRREGMPEKYLVSVDELERYLGGFRIERSGVRMVRHRHGYEERRLPAANVIATRRTDLRTL